MKTNDQFGGWNLLPKGFSLLEIVVVIAIIALLSAVTFGVIDGVKRKNQQARVTADLHLIRNALGDYKVQFGNYPLAKTGDSIQRQRILLQALAGTHDSIGRQLSEPRRPFLSLKLLSGQSEDRGDVTDAWQNPFEYHFDPNWRHGLYFLFSKGPDGLAVLPDSNGDYEPNSPLNLDNLEGFE